MYRAKLFAVLVKVEPTSGVDATPDPAVDAVRCIGIPTIQVGFLDDGDRSDEQTGVLGIPDDAPAVGQYGKLDVAVHVRGAGVAYNSTSAKPECDALLRMSGLARTVTTTVGTESIDYTTADTNMETATVWGYTSAGKLIKLVGCVATMKWSFEAAKRGVLTFSITGKVEAITEAGVPGTLAFSSVIGPAFAGSTVTIGSWSSAAGSDPLILRKVEGDLGNTLAELPSAGAADGHAGYVISDRVVSQTAEFNAGALTSFDIFNVAKSAGTSKPTMQYQLGTTTQYNRLIVNTGRWQIKAPTPGNANQIATYSLSGKLSAASETNSGREIRFRFN
ncbi:MAG TPA: hypothetical protein VHB25_08575 [Gemmatimonadaceae bacterium]|nr:hypothetical protein [Gemmatimonadaceae bacterium]